LHFASLKQTGGVIMGRQIFLLAAFVSAGAVAAQLDMQLFERQDLDKDGFVDRAEARGSVDLQARFKGTSTLTATGA
jgi:hypothetical protein